MAIPELLGRAIESVQQFEYRSRQRHNMEPWLYQGHQAAYRESIWRDDNNLDKIWKIK